HPPTDEVKSFHDVAKAAEEHDKRLKDAEAAALRIRRQADSDAIELERKAQAAASKIVTATESERDAFLAWHRVRNELSPAVEARLMAEKLGVIASGWDPPRATLDLERRRRQRLEL